MKKTNLLFMITFLSLFISCSTDNVNQNEDKQQKTSLSDNSIMANESSFGNIELTNEDKIREDLDIFIENQQSSKQIITNLYSCSESLGNYNNQTYITKSCYLNGYNVPPNTARENILTEYFNFNFNDSNASGNNYIPISIGFEIYNSGSTISAIEANRVYNEFVCQLENTLSSIGGQDFEYKIEFMIGYLLCCDGSSCCLPILSASGFVYY